MSQIAQDDDAGDPQPKTTVVEPIMHDDAHSSYPVDLEAQDAHPTPSSSSTRTTPSRNEDLPRRSLSDNTEKGGEADVQRPGVSVGGEGEAILQHVDLQEEALLALPPPPSYDVVVDNLSVAVPPYRAYIPTPLPIPIPQVVTDTVRHWSAKNSEAEDATNRDAADGLIIRNVNAVVKQGEVMAIIGGSGSGKTTLLHAIAARLGNLPIAEGHVSITPSLHGAGQDNTYPKGGEGHFKGMSKVVGFVRQNDYLLPHLTGTFPYPDGYLPFSYQRSIYSQRNFDVRCQTPSACVRGQQDPDSHRRTDYTRARSCRSGKHDSRWSRAQGDLWRRETTTVYWMRPGQLPFRLNIR